MTALEVNFDGLIGPSHSYAGLSRGNFASARHAGALSSPREAALQGLAKMRHLMGQGLAQGILPPPPRPHWPLLAAAGFSGPDAIGAAAGAAPAILAAAYSASAMWAANAATVSPSADTADERVHITPANLSTMLHRSIEAETTRRLLRAVFADPARFAVGDPLPGHADFADEGAANHTRLAASFGEAGVEVFVHGREAGEATPGFPARQSRLASEAIARRHGLAPARTVHIRQARRAIEAGAFHNDVVAVGSLTTLFFHEAAFEDTAAALAAIAAAAAGLFAPDFVMVPEAEVPLGDAITSYLFNSQLVQRPGETRLTLLAPTETRDTPSTAAFCAKLVASNGPIGRVEYVDVRQSMRNGGGPACLRLRVVLTEAERSAVHPGVLLDEARLVALEAVVRAHYRETLAPADLADPAFAEDCCAARNALLDVLDLAPLKQETPGRWT